MTQKKFFKDASGNTVVMSRNEQNDSVLDNGDKILLAEVRKNMAADAGVTEGDIEDRVMYYAGFDPALD